MKPAGRNNGSLTRRGLLARGAALAAAPYFVPSAALGKDGRPAPSERIVCGGIGLRNRGGHDLRWLLTHPEVQFVAICDIRRDQRDKVKDLVDNHHGNKDCKTYRDLREYLPSRPDIDVMLIATGDRWHALASMMAMKAGKDVYCEKPGTLAIADGQALVKTAERTGRIFQTGTQRLSEAKFAFANELVRSGRLGKVHTVYAHLASWTPLPRFDWLEEQPLPPVDEIDWDMWLGPCPWRPYNKRYVDGGWRGFYDFHSGDIGEWGSHTIVQCQDAIGCRDTNPIEYIHPGNDTGEDMELRYANGVKMILTRKGWHGSCGVRYVGTEGWVSIADGYLAPEVSSPELLSEFDSIVAGYSARTQRTLNHMTHFLDCVKTRRQSVSNAVVAHRGMGTCHGANISLLLGRSLKYDPVKEEFINDPEANRLRRRSWRQPWHV